MKKAIIVDLDGTLSNCDHRRHFVARPRIIPPTGTPKFKPDWDAFYAGLSADKLNEWCYKILKIFYSATASDYDELYSILLVTGRPAEHMQATLDWLQQHHVPFNKLFMRPSGNTEKDCIVKQRIYQEEINGFYEVLFVIEDRQQVVDMWRSLGLTCLQCAKGDF